MEDEKLDLDELEKKVNWSGFERTKGVRVIKQLIAELKSQRLAISALTQTIKDMGDFMQGYKERRHGDEDEDDD